MSQVSCPQGRLPFEYQLKKDDATVTSYGGLPLVLDAARALGVSASLEKHLKVRKYASQHSERAVFETLILSMAAGGECLDDIEVLRGDTALSRLLDMELASPDTVRRMLYACHDDKLVVKAMHEAREKGAVAYVPEENAVLKGLGFVLEDLVLAVAQRGKAKIATVDGDGTIIESCKKEAKWHYDDGRGYQPLLATWAEADLILADEFRDGNVPGAMNPLAFTQKAFAALPKGIQKRRFRGDSAFYNIDQLLWLTRESIEYTISADMTAPLLKTAKSITEASWTQMEVRANDVVHVCETVHFPTNWPKDVKYPRYLLVRLTPTQGHLFESGQGPKYLGVVTNRKGAVQALLRWHWGKAGTIEHVHDVVKNELGGGTLPCGRFGANAAYFRTALITYNLLSALKSLGLPADLHDARPKKLRFHIFTIPAVVTSHARRLLAGLVDRVTAGLSQAQSVLRARSKLWAPVIVQSG
jgi:hypothetical protein